MPEPSDPSPYLLNEGRGEAAWEFAQAHRPDLTRADTWLDLCADRARTHPADTLPIYRDLVTDTMIVTDVRNYRSAAKILKTMRDVARAAGPAHEAAFDDFLEETVHDNRRRTRCLEEFAKAKLIARR